MSISSALSNALSGLTASARAAGVVSSNLANAQVDGYGRRSLELGAQGPGGQGGVRILGVTRHVDPRVLSDRRLADSALSHAQTRAQFLEQVQNAVGTPDQDGSLTGRVAALEASLVTAASRPEAPERLQAVQSQAAGLVQDLGKISARIQSQRMTAEEDIHHGVRTLNTALGQVQKLNTEIAAAHRSGFDISTLQDHRQVVIDRIADLVPVRSLPRENGMVALMTPRGAVLIDGPPAQFDFTRSNVIEPHMTQEGGLLSGLTINGQAVASSGARSPIDGGKLSALFEVRDVLAVDAQAQIDALARDLVERFQAPGLDASRGAGDPGLFTDAGAAFDVADEVGLSARIALNAAVDPAQGGAVWRLRDGLGAVAPGAAGNAALLNALSDTLSARDAMATGDLGVGARSVAGHAGALASWIGQARLSEDQETSFAATRARELEVMLARDGVDSDAETQRMLLIEQAYGANARMIQTINEMMDQLMRI